MLVQATAGEIRTTNWTTGGKIPALGSAYSPSSSRNGMKVPPGRRMPRTVFGFGSVIFSGACWFGLVKMS